MGVIPAEAYKYIYITILGIICLVTYAKLTPYTYRGLITRSYRNTASAVWLYVMVAMFIGSRPISEAFSDMLGYAASYEQLIIDIHKDKGLWWLAGICKKLGFSTSMWFTVVSFIYYGGFLLSARFLSKENTLYIFLTILVSFSALTYATNGIRNGMSMSLLTLAMSIFLTQNNKWKFLSFGIAYYAILTHKSCVLPLICFFVAYYSKAGLKSAIYFWIFSVLISLVAGSQVSNIFIGLGFDDRLDNYILSTDDFTGFSHSGFRFDFLLYSIMPIWLGYYALYKKGVYDRIYKVLLSTYVLSNAFWVMVIRAHFSDRFAYLSWFLYPIVIAYPLLKVDIWGDKQGRKAHNIFLLHFGFTFFMTIIYYTIIKTVL